MKNLNLSLGFIALVAVVCSCSRKPYAQGPVMNQKNITETFTPVLEFMDVKPGVSFADVGAAEGAITVMMSTLMKDATVYIQDIDTIALNQKELDKIIDYYSKESKRNLRAENKYFLTIGDFTHSNLPDHSLDLIYSNATIHVFDSPDAMLADLRTKLKPDGGIFIRDSFKGDHKEGERCSDPKCAKRLLTIDEFLALMDRNGFQLIKRNPDMSGYPVFGFALKK